MKGFPLSRGEAHDLSAREQVFSDRGAVATMALEALSVRGACSADEAPPHRS
jgi:hypothetical protein